MYDVAIIGAGPAGLSFAIHAEELKIIVLEEHKEIGAPVHCGECISDLCLQKFGLTPPKNAIARAVKGVKVIFPKDNFTHLNERGYVLNKNEFEKYLADIVTKKGAEIKTGTRIVGIERKEGYWTLKTDSATDSNTINAKIIIDGTGHVQLISQLLNLNKPSQKVIGVQYLMEDVKNEDYLEFYLWPDLAPQGYLWSIPKDTGMGLANIGLSTSDIKNSKRYLDEFIKIKGYSKIKKTFGGMIPHSGPLKKTYHTGIMLVGDAAGFTSPLFEGGTHLALMSGKIAADVAKQAIAKNDYSKETLSWYEQLWEQEFPPYEKIVKGKDSLYNKLDGNDLAVIGNLLPENFDNFRLKEKLWMGMKMMVINPKLYQKDVVNALTAFGYSKAEAYGW